MTVNWNRQNFAGEDPEKHPAVTALRKNFSGAVREIEFFRGEVGVVIAPEKCRDALRFLKDDPELAFDFLSDVTAVHWPVRKEAPFDVIYQLFSTPFLSRIFVLAARPRSQTIPLLNPRAIK